ncbi:MAG TPA: hypothetical protein VMM79_17965 [Longimicrobiales bacterium]|nr:hypothetical protein [Longimicrobiales bacterium]
MPYQFARLAARCTAVLAAVLIPPLSHAETRLVSRGQNLQAVLNAAAPGDVIVLEAGAEFVGNFVLPVKSGSAPIVVRSTTSDRLPGEGERIHPSHAPLLARIRSPNAITALKTAPGARHWELRYLEFAGNQNGHGDIIQIGDGSKAQNTLDRVPQQLVLAHLYVHGDPRLGQKRCVALNAAYVTIRDSYIADCKGVGMDTQAIGGWNGPGPYSIENNYLEGAGESVLFGGSDPAIPNLVADGIMFRRNHVARPLAWRDPIIGTPQRAAATAQSGGSLPPGAYAYRVIAWAPVGQGSTGRSTVSAEVTAVVSAPGGAVRVAWQAVPHATEYRVYGRTAGAQAIHWTVTTTSHLDTGDAGTPGAVPTSAGTVWTVKNLFELKNARNVVIEDNIFENHWKEAQAGYAIVFTPRNSGGACTWCVVERVRMEHNVVRRVAAGINLLGYDIPSRPTHQTRDIAIRNNLFYEMGKPYGGNGWFLLAGDEPRDVVIDHNTISHAGTSLIYAYGGTSESPRQILGAQVTNNAAPHGSYGINGQSFAYGNGIIEAYFPGASVTGNYLAGGTASRYPPGNRFGGAFELEFVDAAAGDFRLRPGSQLRGTAADGGDIGADIGNLMTRVAQVQAGIGGPSGPLALPPPVAPANVRILGQ